MASAAIVLSTVLHRPSDCDEPAARNSNLLPVKANGEVRLRSPPCIGRRGSTDEPRPSHACGVAASPEPDSIALKAFSSSAPRKTEMIAGGASLAPRRWSWPTPAIDARSSAAWSSTAAMHRGAEEQEDQVLVRRVARLEQVDARVGAHRPVVVLARAVDAGERLLVQQADEAVAARDVLQDLHRQHLVVDADVGVLEDRRDLVLGRRDLVVARLDRHAELGQLLLALEHVGEHALGDRAEVVVVELVALGRLGAEQRAAGRVRGRGARSSTARRSGSTPAPGPTVVKTLLTSSSPSSLQRLERRRVESASIERSSGILVSSASPVHDANAVGMQSSVPLGFSSRNAGELGSQAV